MSQPLTDDELARFEVFQEEKLDAHHAAEDTIRHIFFIGSGVTALDAKRLYVAAQESEACDSLDGILYKYKRDRSAALAALKQLRKLAEKRGDDVSHGVFDELCKLLQG